MRQRETIIDKPLPHSIGHAKVGAMSSFEYLDPNRVGPSHRNNLVLNLCPPFSDISKQWPPCHPLQSQERLLSPRFSEANRSLISFQIKEMMQIRILSRMEE